jgi:hypothetical protein
LTLNGAKYSPLPVNFHAKSVKLTRPGLWDRPISAKMAAASFMLK